MFVVEMKLSLIDELCFDLYVEVYVVDVKVVGYYFLLFVMSEKFVNYLNGVIKGGEVNKV